jgi:drug/metabolite transporter (DMT)-like permease
MGVAGLSLLAAACWGAADFTGGYLARSMNLLMVLLIVNASTVAVSLLVLVGSGGPSLSSSVLLLSVAGGVCGVVGSGAFYQALALGKMGIIAPIPAVGVIIPVAAGWLGGDRFSALVSVGMVIAMVGIVLVSIESSEAEGEAELNRRRARWAIGLALLAAVGLGTQYLLTRPGYADNVPMTVLVARTGPALALLLMVVAWRVRVPPARPAVVGISGGIWEFGALALVGLATTLGSIGVIAVLSSLYPAVTALLATVILKERLKPVQALGATLTLTGVVLIAAG